MPSLSYVNFEIPAVRTLVDGPQNDVTFWSILKVNALSVEVNRSNSIEEMLRVKYYYEGYNMPECRFLAGYNSLRFLMSLLGYTGEFFHGSRADGRTGTLAGYPVFQVGVPNEELLAFLPKQVSDEEFLCMIKRK